MTGNLVKEVNYSPYGQVTYDSQPDLHLPLGPQGGIVDQDVGVIHLQSQGGSTAYDPFLGVYLTPNWEELMENVFKPELFLTYRRNGNDPINNILRAKLGKILYFLSI